MSLNWVVCYLLEEIIVPHTEYAKVKNVLTANTKWGKRRVCNVYTDNGEEAIWAEDLSAFSHIKAGQQIEVIRGVKGGLTILERSVPSPQELPRNVNGKGLKPINEVLSGNTLPIQAYSKRNGNGNSTAVNHQEVVEDTFNDLGFPEPLTDAQKKAIHKLCIERARLLTHCIEVMRNELNHKELEFHEGSLRSLAVSLFIHISKNLP